MRRCTSSKSIARVGSAVRVGLSSQWLAHREQRRGQYDQWGNLAKDAFPKLDAQTMSGLRQEATRREEFADGYGNMRARPPDWEKASCYACATLFFGGCGMLSIAKYRNHRDDQVQRADALTEKMNSEEEQFLQNERERRAAFGLTTAAASSKSS